jgi:hypothetical protein
LLQFANFLTPTPAAPVTVPVDLLFKLVDTANVITVQELALGQVGVRSLHALSWDGSVGLSVHRGLELLIP